MKVQSGLKLMLQFYANHGQLKLVENKTGVLVKDIEKYIEKDIISKENKRRLEKPLNDTQTAFKG